MLLVDVAAENRHAAHAGRERKERLIHRTDNDRTVDFGEIRREVERQTFRRAVKQDAMHREHEHEHEKGAHHVLRDALQTLLNVGTQDEEGYCDRDKEENHVDRRVRDHFRKAE